MLVVLKVFRKKTLSLVRDLRQRQSYIACFQLKVLKVPIVFRRLAASVESFKVPIVFRRPAAIVESLKDLIDFRRSEAPIIIKDLNALMRLEAAEEVLLAFERVQARREKSSSPLSECRREQKKSSSPLSE